MKFLSTIMVLAVSVTPLAAQWAQYRTPGIPRTADGKPNLSAPPPQTASGKPDLTGLWNMGGDQAVGDIAARNAGDLRPADVQPWAQALLRDRAENFGRDNPVYQCLPEGPAYMTGAGGLKRILQTPTMIVVLNEDLTFRQIFMDGRALEADPKTSWMGYSVGRWDGDTLVVESAGFNDRTWLLGGYPHTEALRVTERYRRTDFGHMEIAVTFQDTGTYSRAWTVPVSARLSADTELIETVCNEGSDNEKEHWIGKLSDAEKYAVRVAPEILAKYAGLYKGMYMSNPRTVEVTLSGGALFIAVNGGPKQPLFADSETSFSGNGLMYQFIRDNRGIATDLVEGHVSGDYKYARQQ